MDALRRKPSTLHVTPLRTGDPVPDVGTNVRGLLTVPCSDRLLPVGTIADADADAAAKGSPESVFAVQFVRVGTQRRRRSVYPLRRSGSKVLTGLGPDHAQTCG